MDVNARSSLPHLADTRSNSFKTQVATCTFSQTIKLFALLDTRFEKCPFIGHHSPKPCDKEITEEIFLVTADFC